MEARQNNSNPSTVTNHALPPVPTSTFSVTRYQVYGTRSLSMSSISLRMEAEQHRIAHASLASIHGSASASSSPCACLTGTP